MQPNCCRVSSNPMREVQPDSRYIRIREGSMKLTCRIAVLVGLVAVAACGGDDDGKAGAAGARDGAGGKNARSGGMGGDGSSGTDGGGKVVACGAKTSRVPKDSLIEVCCNDQFTGACGVQVGEMCMQMR